jgi:CPA2 family monovalent cation:H+ antiporter-2
VFSALFFVAVGMLFDPSILLRQPLQVLAVVATIVVGKSLAALAIVLAFRYPLDSALTVAAALAQIGEFSFILAGLGVSLGLLPPEARDLILAGALLSIALNPFLFAGIPATVRWIGARPRLLAALERPSLPASIADAPAGSPATDHAIVVGHGRVGRSITSVLEREKLPFVVVESDRPRFDAFRARGGPAVLGDATSPAVLQEAGIDRARLLIVAMPDSFQARRVLEIAEAANPGIHLVVRTHSEEEESDLLARHPGQVVMGERELARAMLFHALRRFGVPAERARLLVEDPASADIVAEADRR